MSVDLGDRTEDSLIYFMWSTNAADGSSVTRAVDGTISVYKNDDLSQSVVGVTDTEDFDTLTGVHMCKIDTSADAFYAIAEDYTVVLSGATIDGQSVNAVLAVFSIENRFMQGTDSAALSATALSNAMWTDAKAGALTDWINGGRLDLILDLVAADTNELQGDWVDGGRLDLLIDRIRTATEIKQSYVDDPGATATTTKFVSALIEPQSDFWNRMAIIFTSGNNTGQMRRIKDYDGVTKEITLQTPLDAAPANADTFIIPTVRAFLTPDIEDIADAMMDELTADHTIVGSLSKAVSDALTDTDDLQTNQGAWATATGFNTVTPDAAGVTPTAVEIRIEMDTNSTKMAPSQTLNDYKATGFNTVVPDVAGTAATPAEVAAALTNLHLDHLLAADYDPASKPGVATALLNELVENDGGTARYTANALEQAPSGGTNPNVLIDTTIATVTDQTHIILTAGSADNDAYKDQAVVVYDASVSDYPSVRKVSGYVGSTKTITLDAVPDFTMVNGDGVRVFVTAPGTTAPTVGQIRAEMEGAGYKLALIEADTNDLQTNQSDWATATIAALSAQGKLDVNAACDTALSDYGANTTVPDVAGTAAGLHATTNGKVDTVDANVDSILVDTATTIPGTITTLQTDSTAIKAKTDALPSGIAKNVALAGFNVYVVLTSDHVTAATGKTIAGTISKDGAAFTSLANAVSEIGTGMYKVDLTQAEMNANVVTLKFTSADCDQRVITIYTS